MKNPKLILASKSPRRRDLLKQAGLQFELQLNPVTEKYDAELTKEAIPLYLAELKAKGFEGKLKDNEIAITADTIVWMDGEVFEKPKNKQEATDFLKILSGKKHEVITGVCLLSNQKKHTFYESTKVYFKSLTDRQIRYYIENYEVMDKAGAYGVQEWIGLIGINKIEGCYYNVVGLPIAHLLEALTTEFDYKLA